MNLQRLETFVAVAHAGSFRQAAETLHRSQSAVSKHVQQLEAELGVALFERTTRRVAITAEGRVLLNRFNAVLEELRAIPTELREHSDLRRGRVSIGAVPSISSQRLPATIAAFKRRYPGVTIELHEGFATHIYRDVQERKTDFAVGPLIDGVSDFRCEPVVTDRFVAVVPSGHPLAKAAEVSLADVAAGPQLCTAEGTALRESVEEAFRRARLRFEAAIEVSHHQTLFSLVAAGLGVALLPRLCVPAGRQRRCTIVPLAAPGIEREICIVTLRGKTPTPAAQRFAEMISAALRRAPRQGSDA